MKYGATADASVSQKICTRTRKRCGMIIACNRESGGLIPYCTAMMRIAPGASNEKTRVNGNKSRADVLRGAIDLRKSPLALTVSGEV